MSSNARQQETWSMTQARLRNQMEQRALDHRLQALTSGHRSRSNRLMVEMGQLEEHVKLGTHVGGKAIICPTGLTEREKAQYRQQRRRSSTPSMTLGEFDLRITHFRNDMMVHRRGSHSTKKYDDVFLEDAGIVNLEEHEFCAPLTKHKHTMKEALKRASEPTSANAVFPAPLPTRSKSASSYSETEEDSTVTVSVFVPTQSKDVQRFLSHAGQTEDVVEQREAAAGTDLASGVRRPQTAVGTKTGSGIRPHTAVRTGLRSGIRPQTAVATNIRHVIKRPQTAVAVDFRLGARRPQTAVGRSVSSPAASPVDARRDSIIICPDYIAVRRRSSTTVVSAGAARH